MPKRQQYPRDTPELRQKLENLQLKYANREINEAIGGSWKGLPNRMAKSIDAGVLPNVFGLSPTTRRKLTGALVSAMGFSYWGRALADPNITGEEIVYGDELRGDYDKTDTWRSPKGRMSHMERFLSTALPEYGQELLDAGTYAVKHPLDTAKAGFREAKEFTDHPSRYVMEKLVAMKELAQNDPAKFLMYLAPGSGPILTGTAKLGARAAVGAARNMPVLGVGVGGLGGMGGMGGMGGRSNERTPKHYEDPGTNRPEGDDIDDSYPPISPYEKEEYEGAERSYEDEYPSLQDDPSAAIEAEDTPGLREIPTWQERFETEVGSNPVEARVRRIVAQMPKAFQDNFAKNELKSKDEVISRKKAGWVLPADPRGPNANIRRPMTKKELQASIAEVNRPRTLPPQLSPEHKAFMERIGMGTPRSKQYYQGERLMESLGLDSPVSNFKPIVQKIVTGPRLEKLEAESLSRTNQAFADIRSLKELRERAESASTRLREMLAVAENEDRELTDKENASREWLEDDIKQFNIRSKESGPIVRARDASHWKEYLFGLSKNPEVKAQFGATATDSLINTGKLPEGHPRDYVESKVGDIVRRMPTKFRSDFWSKLGDIDNMSTKDWGKVLRDLSRNQQVLRLLGDPRELQERAYTPDVPEPTNAVGAYRVIKTDREKALVERQIRQLPEENRNKVLRSLDDSPTATLEYWQKVSAMLKGPVQGVRYSARSRNVSETVAGASTAPLRFKDDYTTGDYTGSKNRTEEEIREDADAADEADNEDREKRFESVEIPGVVTDWSKRKDRNAVLKHVTKKAAREEGLNDEDLSAASRATSFGHDETRGVGAELLSKFDLRRNEYIAIILERWSAANREDREVIDKWGWSGRSDAEREADLEANNERQGKIDQEISANKRLVTEAKVLLGIPLDPPNPYRSSVKKPQYAAYKANIEVRKSIDAAVELAWKKLDSAERSILYRAERGIHSEKLEALQKAKLREEVILLHDRKYGPNSRNRWDTHDSGYAFKSAMLTAETLKEEKRTSAEYFRSEEAGYGDVEYDQAVHKKSLTDFLKILREDKDARDKDITEPERERLDKRDQEDLEEFKKRMVQDPPPRDPWYDEQDASEFGYRHGDTREQGSFGSGMESDELFLRNTDLRNTHILEPLKAHLLADNWSVDSDTFRRFLTLVQQDKGDVVRGGVSSGPYVFNPVTKSIMFNKQGELDELNKHNMDGTENKDFSEVKFHKNDGQFGVSPAYVSEMFSLLRGSGDDNYKNKLNKFSEKDLSSAAGAGADAKSDFAKGVQHARTIVVSSLKAHENSISGLVAKSNTKTAIGSYLTNKYGMRSRQRVSRYYNKVLREKYISMLVKEKIIGTNMSEKQGRAILRREAVERFITRVEGLTPDQIAASRSGEALSAPLQKALDAAIALEFKKITFGGTSDNSIASTPGQLKEMRKALVAVHKSGPNKGLLIHSKMLEKLGLFSPYGVELYPLNTAIRGRGGDTLTPLNNMAEKMLMLERRLAKAEGRDPKSWKQLEESYLAAAALEDRKNRKNLAIHKSLAKIESSDTSQRSRGRTVGQPEGVLGELEGLMRSPADTPTRIRDLVDDKSKLLVRGALRGNSEFRHLLDSLEIDMETQFITSKQYQKLVDEAGFDPYGKVNAKEGVKVGSGFAEIPILNKNGNIEQFRSPGSEKTTIGFKNKFTGKTVYTEITSPSAIHAGNLLIRLHRANADSNRYSTRKYPRQGNIGK